MTQTIATRSYSTKHQDPISFEYTQKLLHGTTAEKAIKAALSVLTLFSLPIACVAADSILFMARSIKNLTSSPDPKPFIAKQVTIPTKKEPLEIKSLALAALSTIVISAISIYLFRQLSATEAELTNQPLSSRITGIFPSRGSIALLFLGVVGLFGLSNLGEPYDISDDGDGPDYSKNRESLCDRVNGWVLDHSSIDMFDEEKAN